MSGIPPQMRRGTARGRASVQRVQAVAAQDTWVMGHILVEGIGETSVDVLFPVTFSEKPLPILGGGEYIGKAPKWNSYPTAAATVVAWKTMDQANAGDANYRYTGCTLAVTTTGELDQQLYVTFAFIGLAMTNMATE